MNDLTDIEIAAIDFASQCAGEYLESISCSDLSKISQEQWKEFLKVVCLRFLDKKIELTPCPF